MDEALVEREERGAISILNMVYRRHNLLGPKLMGALAVEMNAARDAGSRAIVLRSGLRHFCAGADVSLFGARIERRGERSSGIGDVEFLKLMELLPILIVASVHGVCLGGGFELALACDYIVAASSAKIGSVEAALGLHPLLGGIQRQVQRAGAMRAKEISVLGRRHDPATLERWGLVNLVVADDTLEAATFSIAEELAHGPTVAHAATKRLVHIAVNEGVLAADEAMAEVQKPIWASEDIKIGLASFRENGPGLAKFTGLPSSRGAEMSGPLGGIRVVDFSRGLAGPLCARTLLDLGAEVIKVEPPRPDVSRFAFPSARGMSGYYAQQNAGKRNVSIDLNVPDARQLALRLCDTADVIVENFRAGTLGFFGLDYDTLAARNPRLIYASLTGYGQGGPGRGRMAYAPTVQAEAGFAAQSTRHYGAALSEARTDSLSHADVYAGLQAAVAILAALNRRSVTGTGQYIDVAMAATLMAINEHAHVDLGNADLGDEPAILGATDCPFFEGPNGEHLTVATSLVGSRMFPSYLRAVRSRRRSSLRHRRRTPSTPGGAAQRCADLDQDICRSSRARCPVG